MSAHAHDVLHHHGHDRNYLAEAQRTLEEDIEARYNAMQATRDAYLLKQKQDVVEDAEGQAQIAALLMGEDMRAPTIDPAAMTTTQQRLAALRPEEVVEETEAELESRISEGRVAMSKSRASALESEFVGSDTGSDITTQSAKTRASLTPTLQPPAKRVKQAAETVPDAPPLTETTAEAGPAPLPVEPIEEKAAEVSESTAVMQDMINGTPVDPARLPISTATAKAIERVLDTDETLEAHHRHNRGASIGSGFRDTLAARGLFPIPSIDNTIADNQSILAIQESVASGQDMLDMLGVKRPLPSASKSQSAEPPKVKAFRDPRSPAPQRSAATSRSRSRPSVASTPMRSVRNREATPAAVAALAADMADQGLEEEKVKPGGNEPSQKPDKTEEPNRLRSRDRGKSKKTSGAPRRNITGKKFGKGGKRSRSASRASSNRSSLFEDAEPAETNPHRRKIRDKVPTIPAFRIPAPNYKEQTSAADALQRVHTDTHGAVLDGAESFSLGSVASGSTFDMSLNYDQGPDKILDEIPFGFFGTDHQVKGMGVMTDYVRVYGQLPEMMQNEAVKSFEEIPETFRADAAVLHAYDGVVRLRGIIETQKREPKQLHAMLMSLDMNPKQKAIVHNFIEGISREEMLEF